MRKIVGKIATFLAIATFVFLGVTGGLVYEMETIPDNALIVVFPSRGKWAPNSDFMKRDFEEQLRDPKRMESALKWLEEVRPARYSDVKKGGKYESFETFPVLMEEPGRVTRGWHGSWLMSWFTKKPRWNPDGSWNW